MQVLLDESGDLGWNFEAEYRKGGSSRYLTLAFMFLPKIHRILPKNVMRFMYNKYGWKKEKKAQSATLKQKLLFCKKVCEMLDANSSIKIETITVNKVNVRQSIRSDANKLYNYMTALIVPDYVKNLTRFEFMPDERTIKVKSGNSLVDHLQTKLWFEYGSDVILKNLPTRSHESYNLQFIDWVAHCVWINFEDKISDPFTQLSPKIKHRPLFFDKDH